MPLPITAFKSSVRWERGLPRRRQGYEGGPCRSPYARGSTHCARGHDALTRVGTLVLGASVMTSSRVHQLDYRRPAGSPRVRPEPNRGRRRDESPLAPSFHDHQRSQGDLGAPGNKCSGGDEVREGEGRCERETGLCILPAVRSRAGLGNRAAVVPPREGGVRDFVLVLRG